MHQPQTQIQTSLLKQQMNILSNEEKQWRQTTADQMLHFKGKVSVCCILCYCDCIKHESIAILFVQQYANDKFTLPGGKRDQQGIGRAQFSKHDESCWNAAKSEFKEEVDDDILDHCQDNCPSFDTKHIFTRQIDRNMNDNKVFTRNEPQYVSETVQFDRIIKTYYFKMSCEQIPDKEFGRFRMFETQSRKWLQLEFIINQFKHQYRTDRSKMSISPMMFKTIQQFGIIISKTMNNSLDQLRNVFGSDKSNQILMHWNQKVFKSNWLFKQINQYVPDYSRQLSENRKEFYNIIQLLPEHINSVMVK